MTTEPNDNLTTIETTLRDVLVMLAADRTGSIARAHGWPQPETTHVAEMTSLITRALTALVIGMRDPRALPPSSQEIGDVLTGIALGVLERVMGPRPTSETVH